MTSPRPTMTAIFVFAVVMTLPPPISASLRGLGQQEMETLMDTVKQLQEQLAVQDIKIERLKVSETEQKAKMADMEGKIVQMENIVKKQASEIADMKQSASRQQARLEHLDQIEIVAVSRSKRAAYNSQELPPHHVSRRSDDLGAFEAELNHVTQRVTQLTATVTTLQYSSSQEMAKIGSQMAATATALQTSASQQATLVNQQIAGVGARVTALNASVTEAATSTYVQWGSSSCTAASADLVYSGVVGGPRYDHGGGNYVCLTMRPVFSDHPIPPALAFLYGSEYQTYDSNLDKDPVCAMCRVTLPTTLMMPGTNTCEKGWTLQYAGYLMAGYYGNNGGKDFVCVDSRLESFPHSNANEDGAGLLYTATRCGALPCDPYVNNKVVTCAVCSK